MNCQTNLNNFVKKKIMKMWGQFYNMNYVFFYKWIFILKAVKCYLDGVEFVSEFKRFPSLEAIKIDCQQIVETIRTELYQDFVDSEVFFSNALIAITIFLNNFFDWFYRKVLKIWLEMYLFCWVWENLLQFWDNDFLNMLYQNYIKIWTP